MIKNLQNLRGIIGENANKIFFLMPLFVISALLETLSIGLIAPLISVLSDDSLIREYLSPIGIIGEISTGHLQLLVLGAFLLVYLLKNLYSIFFFYYSEKVLVDIRLKLHDFMFYSYLNTDYEFHLENNRSKLKRNIDEIGTVFQSYLSPLILLSVEIVILSGVVVLLSVVNPLVTIVSFALVGILSFVAYAYVKPLLRKIGDERIDAAEKINRHIYQGLGAIKEVKVLRKEDFFSNKFHKNMGDFLKLNLMNGVYNMASVLAIEAVFVIITVVVVFFALQSPEQQDNLPVLALYAMAAIRLLQSTKKISMSVNQMSYAESSLNLISKEIERVKRLDLPKRKELRHVNFLKEIEIRSLDYQYRGSSKKTLNAVDINIKRRTCVAVVGHSGSGKTTLLNIFLGLLSASEGVFSIDGKKYENLSILGSSVGYVPQNVYITDDSIENNVAFGVKASDIDRDKVIRSLKSAHLYDFVSTLKDGLSTVLGEEGSRLSGGQRQRLGIARALYSDPDIIIFDEMTASLDNATEYRIMQEVFHMSKTKTIIIITHKINTIKKCDNIYLLNDGGVEGSGSYNDLYASNSTFRGMADGYNYQDMDSIE